MEFKRIIEIKNEEDTRAFGLTLAEEALPGTVYALIGDLGTGKTTLTKSIAEGLGIERHITSPTFTIVNEYLGDRTLIHFDMYRLGSADELFDIGWEDYLARGAVCAVEWSENVEEAFYGDEIILTIEKTSDTSRKITIEGADVC